MTSIFKTAVVFCFALILNADFLAAQDVTIVVKPKNTPPVEIAGSAAPPFAGVRPAVNVAIVLDTSNSMDGLIDQAKSQLWTIVQQFSRAEKDGMTPQLRVSVFEYGNSGLPASEGYIRQAVQLTDDLDKISEALFSLKTKGGDEYCGQVIAETLQRLDWSDKPNSYKAIFIAGNEPFTQGSVDYRDACKSAIENGVIVNTIHCGNYDTGIATKWKSGADLAEGEYMNIDQDRKTVHIETPHDEIIIRLNKELNSTYLWFGNEDDRTAMAMNQTLQDSNAAKASPSSSLSRAQSKASELYSFKGRDLVDTTEDNEAFVEGLDDSQLPQEMKNMTVSQRKEHVAKQAAARKEIQAKIEAATAARGKFITAKRKQMAQANGEATLGDAMGAAVVRQLQKAGFKITDR